MAAAGCNVPAIMGTRVLATKRERTIACALVGFIDDYMKLVRRRSLGLRAKTKMVALALISVGLWQLAVHKAGLSSNLNLHIAKLDDPVIIHLGILYPFVVYLCVAGTTNGVNLADGLDGLAAGCAAIVLLAFVLITSISSGDQDLGSFALGGAIAGLAVMTQTELLLILIGGIFVIEALSVLIQVVSFQAFRRRVFLMAPIHHHFELKGWSETKIILRFWIIASVGAAIGFVIYQHSIHK